MTTFLKKLRKNQCGQSLVELALIIPILVVLLMSTIEFGRIFFTYLSVTHAAREAARSTIVSTEVSDTTIKQKVIDNASWLSSTDIVVNITPSSPTNRTTGVPLTVSVSYPVELFTPVLSDIMTNPFTVQSEITMRIE